MAEHRTGELLKELPRTPSGAERNPNGRAGKEPATNDAEWVQPVNGGQLLHHLDDEGGSVLPPHKDKRDGLKIHPFACVAFTQKSNPISKKLSPDCHRWCFATVL